MADGFLDIIADHIDAHQAHDRHLSYLDQVINMVWRKDEKYVFSKEKKDGMAAVFKVPDGKQVRYDKQARPLLKADEE